MVGFAPCIVVDQGGTTMDHYDQRIFLSGFVVMRIIKNTLDSLIESSLPINQFRAGNAFVFKTGTYIGYLYRRFKTVAPKLGSIPLDRNTGLRILINERFPVFPK